MVVAVILYLVGFGLLPLAEFVPEGARSVWLVVTFMIAFVGGPFYWVNSSMYLMGVTDPEVRSHAFSLRTALLPLAGFVGSLIGGWLPGTASRRPGAEPGGGGSLPGRPATGGAALPAGAAGYAPRRRGGAQNPRSRHPESRHPESRPAAPKLVPSHSLRHHPAVGGRRHDAAQRRGRDCSVFSTSISISVSAPGPPGSASSSGWRC